MVDDLLATGGTIEATVKLIRRLGGEVADAAFIINLFDLGGEQRLENRALPATALSRSGPLIIVSLALLTLRAAQDVHSASPF